MEPGHLSGLECSIETVVDDSITASDEHGIIGKGTHIRFVINLDRFMKKLSERN
ncbi:MAG: hypothetical protein KAT09_09175 [Candidatus Aegiribacteria sp.]|nr:hypothetical protein [Candidatus Aegiribacteria sp.]